MRPLLFLVSKVKPQLHGPLGIQAGAKRVIDCDEYAPAEWFDLLKPFHWLLESKVSDGINLLQRKLMAKADAGNLMAEIKKMNLKKVIWAF